tara:strand:- start:810 stop:1109 length:300 start_codon:yes stop_codon:yes gene_type:complete
MSEYIIMRKIEQQMINAIHNKENFSFANTMVNYVSEVNSSAIYLHGNHIATFVHYDGGVVPNADTFRDWPTPTTRSRLRALGVDASIKNFAATIDGVEL